jgi:hypothetical protein
VATVKAPEAQAYIPVKGLTIRRDKAEIVNEGISER